jgi:phage baseplate assembly protein W
MSYGTTLELDASGDVTITELNTLGMVTGVEKVKQDLRVLLKTVKGEHPENPDFGVDWLRIKQSGMKERVIKAELTRALKLYPWLKSVDEITIGSLDENRTLSISVKVTLTSGEQVTAEVQA